MVRLGVTGGGTPGPWTEGSRSPEGRVEGVFRELVKHSRQTEGRDGDSVWDQTTGSRVLVPL